MSRRDRRQQPSTGARSTGSRALEPLLKQAVAQHQLGNLAGAAHLYLRILERDPKHFDALHLLGVVRLQEGRPEQSLQYITSGLAQRPGSAPALSNLAAALQALDRHEEALQSLDRALAIDAGNLSAHVNRGMVLAALQRHAEAISAFDRALALDSRQPEVLHHRGNALLALGQHADSVASQDRALALRPDYPDALNNRGISLRALGRHENALETFRQALACAPGNAEAANNLGTALHTLGRYDEAVASYDRAFALNPGYADALYNRGNALKELNRHFEAIAAFEQVVALAPDHAEAHWNLALARLCVGDLQAGWREYEWRFRRPHDSPPSAADRPRLSADDALAGRRVLVWAEQGLGDTVQFCRFAPALALAGAEVVLEVQPALRSLLCTLPGVSVIARGEAVPDHDAQCPLLSLPLVMNTSLGNIPGRAPYLVADEARVADWRAWLGKAAGPAIGLVCSGNPGNTNDHNRSMPLRRFAPVIESGARCCLLQERHAERDAAYASAARGIVDLRERLTDFAETAAAIACMDLVISIDTAVAHLAGALGKPCWVLLPFSPDWRWLLEREDSPWYPSMRLFRQPRIGDWESVVARVVQELAALPRDASP